MRIAIGIALLLGQVELARFASITPGASVAAGSTVRRIYVDPDGINIVVSTADSGDVTFVLSSGTTKAGLAEIGGVNLWYRRASASATTLEEITKGLAALLRNDAAQLRPMLETQMRNLPSPPAITTPKKTKAADAERFLQALTGSFSVIATSPDPAAPAGNLGRGSARIERLPGVNVIQERGEGLRAGKSLLIYSVIGYEPHEERLWYFALTDNAFISGWGDWNESDRSVSFAISKGPGKEPEELVVLRLADERRHSLEHFQIGPDGARTPMLTLAYERR